MFLIKLIYSCFFKNTQQIKLKFYTKLHFIVFRFQSRKVIKIQPDQILSPETGFIYTIYMELCDGINRGRECVVVGQARLGCDALERECDCEAVLQTRGKVNEAAGQARLWLAAS